MTKISALDNIVGGFFFTKGDYSGAESQLLEFAEGYAHLSGSEAESLRKEYSSKARLGWFRIGAALLDKVFDDAGQGQQKNLLKIFFALYSFENLEFGYDALMDVIRASDKIKSSDQDAAAIWADYKALTSNIVAVENLENKLF